MQETIAFGAGCFWCTEAVYRMLKGVHSVLPGYAGGTVVNPTYEQVSAGNTGHIEVAKIQYDPDVISFEELLTVFFAIHDPTSADRQALTPNLTSRSSGSDGTISNLVSGQGNDIGPQYNSAIFYTTESQKKRAEHYIQVLNERMQAKIITRVGPLTDFYPAEDYHKKYYESHKDAPYCQVVIDPKLDKVREKFSQLLKSDAEKQ